MNSWPYVHGGGRKVGSLTLCLDPVTGGAGCLRLIPDSHRHGDKFGDDLQGNWSDPLTTGTRMRGAFADLRYLPIALETAPGNLLMFNHSIQQTSFGGGAAKRMFTINLEERHRDEATGELRNLISHGARIRFGRSC